MSDLQAIRELTGTVRGLANHGCKPVEVLPGLWSASFKDIDTPDKLAIAAPTVSTIINAGGAQCNASYGDKIEVLRIDVNDDPEAKKKVIVAGYRRRILMQCDYLMQYDILVPVYIYPIWHSFVILSCTVYQLPIYRYIYQSRSTLADSLHACLHPIYNSNISIEIHLID